MAITFRHDVPAGLIGSFAAGQAAGRRRRQKYAMDLLARRQGQRFQLQRDVLRRQEARDLVGLRGEQAEGLLEQRGEQQLELQGMRGVQQGQLEFQRFGQRQRLLEQAGEQGLDLEGVRNQLDLQEHGRASVLDRLEKEGFSPTQKTAAQKILSELGALEQSTILSPQDDGAQQKEIARLEGDLQDILDAPEGERPMSLQERFAQDIHTAEDGSKYQWLGPDKGWSEVPSKAADSAAKEQKAKDDQIIKRYNEYRKERDSVDESPLTGMDDDALFEKAQKDYQHEQRRRMELSDSGQAEAVPPVSAPAPEMGGQLPIPSGVAMDPGVVPPVPAPAAQPQPAAVAERVAQTSRLRKGPTPGAAAAAGPQPTDLPQVRGDADYDKLDEDTEFIDAETGLKWRKPFKVRPGGPTFFDLMVR